MKCPRCDGTLAIYTFREHAARTCEDCGYVGMSVEHASRRAEGETWEQAIQRFRSKRENEMATEE